MYDENKQLGMYIA